MTPSNSYSQQWHHHREKTSYFIQTPTITSSFITIKFIFATSVLPFRQTHFFTTELRISMVVRPCLQQQSLAMWTLCECCWKRKAIKIPWISRAEVPSPRWTFRRRKKSLEDRFGGDVWKGGFGPWCEVLVGFVCFVWFFGGLTFWYPERLKVLCFFLLIFLLVGCFWHPLEWECVCVCVCTDFILIYSMYSKYMWPLTTASFIVSY